MKIRPTLLALTSILGTVLIAAVALQIRAEMLDYREAQRLVISNAVREQLLLGAAALAEERTRTYALLLDPGSRAQGNAELRSIRSRVDAIRSATEGHIAAGAVLLGDPAGSRRSLETVTRDLNGARAEADAALISHADEGRRHAPRWFQQATQVVDEVVSLRLTLLQQERPQDPAILTESLLRYYSGLF